MMVDRVDGGVPVYVCTNRQCLEYLKAKKEGEETSTSIVDSKSNQSINTENNAE